MRSIRLKGYDYRNQGYYFITVVTGEREQHFGSIVSLKMNLSSAGSIAIEELFRCSELREHVFIDEYVIMPDHVHFILIISQSPDSAAVNPATDYFSSISPKPGSVSAVVRSFKSAVTKRCHASGLNSFSWQRGFYDRIIRDQNELAATREYIRGNPEKWVRDNEL